MTSRAKQFLRLPAALAVVVIAGCSESSTPSADASTGPRDASVAMADATTASDAGRDAGCLPGQPFDPITMMCEPLG